MIINRIQVLNYGCLRYVDVPMDRFHVLIGPNATGKSTLMDAIKFVSDVVKDGVESAWRSRTSNFADLVWERPVEPERQRFEIVLEFILPDDVRALLPSDRGYRFFRYTLAVGMNPETNQIGIDEERGALLVGAPLGDRQLSFFPEPMVPIPTMVQRSRPGMRTTFGKSRSGRVDIARTGKTDLSRAGAITLARNALNLAVSANRSIRTPVCCISLTPWRRCQSAAVKN